jgi:hypothetical protein
MENDNGQTSTSQLVPQVGSPDQCTISVSSLNISSASSKSTISNNITVIVQETSMDRTGAQIKFVSILSVLCCICFPITGIWSIFYSRKTRDLYELHEIVKARVSLSKTEYTLVVTIFLGVISLSIGLLLIELYFIRPVDDNSFLKKLIGRSLPK